MSRFQLEDPHCANVNNQNFVEQIIVPRTGDIGNFEVRRALPSKERRTVGPFIFWDQMGPGEFITGQGVDVRPHPHIGLSTLTYLFQGTLDHRDSLGVYQRIKPGEVNFMTSGSGVVHSERTGKDVRLGASSLFGIQSWIALPKDKEEIDPSFVNYTKEKLPVIVMKEFSLRVIAGEFMETRSPLMTFNECLYVDAELKAGATLPIDSQVEERALYPLYGDIEIGGVLYKSNQLLILRPKDRIVIKAHTNTRLMILGGSPLDGPRHIWWNFVSSSRDRIENAKKAWQEGLFQPVPNEIDFTPLPDR